MLVALSATESCLENFPTILTFKAQINAKYPQVVPSFVDIADQPRKQHGIKNSSWINVDGAKIDKTKSIANSQAPSNVAAQYSVMQYCMDIRLDQVWKELMEYLLLESDNLPPNPYSHAASFFRKASVSVQVFFETDSNAASQIIQRKLAPVEGLSEVFNVSGTSGYGRRSALIFFSSLGFRKLSAVVPSLFLSPPGESASGLAMQLGQFRLTVASGLVAPCPYYGSMSPYLYSIEIDEHLFLYGPPDFSRTAFSQLAQTVLSHLLQLRSQGAVLHQINFGQVQLDLFVLVYSAARFESEFSATVEGNHSVLLSFYYPVSWRYVLVRKRLMVYLTDHATNRTTRMFQLTSSTEKRGTTVFLHPLDANISIRPGRIIAQSMTGTIKSSWPSRDWSRIVKQLAMQAQLMASGSESKINLFADSVTKESQSNILTAFCYRYYNALPGQIDYLLSLNNSLENVMSHAVSTLDERYDLSSVVNLPLMDKMMEEYMTKLKQITSTPSALAPTSFSDFLLSKLRKVAQRDANSNALHISYTTESIEVLREVSEYLTVLRNLLADDLLKVNPAISSVINNQLAN